MEILANTGRTSGRLGQYNSLTCSEAAKGSGSEETEGAGETWCCIDVDNLPQTVIKFCISLRYSLLLRSPMICASLSGWT